MQFAFTSQQLEFRDAVRAVLDKECTPGDVRALYEAPTWRTPRWRTLADLGVVGMTVPAAHGGLGLGMVDLVVVLEEAGRFALPEPLGATAGLAAPLLAELDDDRDTGTGRWAECLAAIVAGEAAGAAAVGPEEDPVAGADGATVLLLSRPRGHGPALFALSAGMPGWDAAQVRAVPALDPTRRLARVGLAQGVEPVAVGDRAAALARQLTWRGAVTTAAELCGLADRLVTMAADYARARHQFARPIGSFQAVKHLLAGARVKNEFARPAVYAAAWALDEGEPDAARRASAAKSQASDAALEAARVALQVHGAIGYTWESDLHLFLKRAWALAAAWGSAAEHRAALLASLVAERQGPAGN